MYIEDKAAKNGPEKQTVGEHEVPDDDVRPQAEQLAVRDDDAQVPHNFLNGPAHPSRAEQRRAHNSKSCTSFLHPTHPTYDGKTGSDCTQPGPAR